MGELDADRARILLNLYREDSPLRGAKTLEVLDGERKPCVAKSFVLKLSSSRGAFGGRARRADGTLVSPGDVRLVVIV